MAPSAAEAAGASSDIEAAYRAWIACVNERRWPDVPQYVDAIIEHNGTRSARAAWVTQLQQQLANAAGAHGDEGHDADGDEAALGTVSLHIDNLIVDRATQVLASRLWVVAGIRRRPTSPAGTGSPRAGPARGKVMLSEQHFVWFSADKQSKMLSLRARDSERSNAGMSQSDQAGAEGNLAGLTPSLRRTPMARIEASRMEETYRAYIACINARRMESDLALFCCSAGVIHNARTLTVAAYGAMIQESIAALPDLHFGIHTLLVDQDSQRLAVRLEFRGTPVSNIEGLVPTGRAVHFAEHVSYQLVEGRIARVWSIVDWAAARAEQAQQAQQAQQQQKQQQQQQGE